MTEEEFQRIKDFILNPINKGQVGVVIFSSVMEKDSYVRLLYSQLADYPFFTRRTKDSCGTITSGRLIFLVDRESSRVYTRGLYIDKIFNQEALSNKELWLDLKTRMRTEKDKGKEKSE